MFLIIQFLKEQLFAEVKKKLKNYKDIFWGFLKTYFFPKYKS